MARPLKIGPKLDKDVRIPVTPEQRKFLNDAVRLIGSDFAGWARPILLSEAQKIVDEHGGSNQRKSKKRRTGVSIPPSEQPGPSASL